MGSNKNKNKTNKKILRSDTFTGSFILKIRIIQSHGEYKKNTSHGNEVLPLLRISYKDHVTNEEVLAKVQQAIGPHEDLLTNVKRRKLQ